MAGDNTTFVIVYEPGHVLALGPYLARGAKVFALDRATEYLLEERQIPFMSAKTYRGTRQFERIVYGAQIVEDLCKSREWDFFIYRNISLSEIFRFSLQEYLAFFLYYIDVFARLAEASPEHEWVILPPINPPPRNGGPLASYMHMVVGDAARLVAGQKHIRVTVIAPAYPRAAAGALRLPAFSLVRDMSGFLLNLFMRFLTLGMPHKDTRILTTDLWRNIKTIVQEIPDVDITLSDRSEARHIPWGLLRAHRMAFVNLGGAVTTAERRAAERAHDEFAARWQSYTQIPVQYAGVDLAPQLARALATLVTEASLPVLFQIEHAYRLIPGFNLVLLRASVSGQTHHVVLALVARALGVPSVELQHGLEYLGPGSLSLNHTAEYIATYGPLINSEFAALGYDERRLISVGSPRFDAYPARNVAQRSARVLCIGPSVYPGGTSDSYDCEEYFRMFFSSLPEGSQPVVKLRQGVHEDLLQKMIEYTRGAWTPSLETGAPLADLLQTARVVVSCYSTAILESLLMGVPTILLASSDLERRVGAFHFGTRPYEGAILMVSMAEELDKAFSAVRSEADYVETKSKIISCMQANYRFDGGATKRVSSYIRETIFRAKDTAPTKIF